MKVTLKNVKFSEHMSEETNAFTADVCVDGKVCGYAKNDGCGGSTNVQSCWNGDEKTKPLVKLFRDCEEYLKTQPQINIGTEDEPYMIDSNMESVVDEMFEQWLKEKDKKKLEKKMIDRIMWGVPNGMTYTEVKFKRPLSEIPKPILQNYLNKYKTEFKEGQKFLNTNLVGFEL